ncbi:MAG: MFS transporter, partial [Actinomycetes bacterium]
IQQVAGFAGLALVQIGFVFGFGSLVWVYASEAFPGRMRAYGTSALLTADLLANVIIAQFTLIAIDRFGQTAVFLVFAVLAVFALLFVAKFAPETKGRPLDDIRFFWENGGKWPATGAGSAPTASGGHKPA